MFLLRNPGYGFGVPDVDNFDWFDPLCLEVYLKTWGEVECFRQFGSINKKHLKQDKNVLHNYLKVKCC